jgi:hypothetical protein
MTVRPTPVSYPIFGGVDTKASGFVLPPPKLQEVTNAYASESGSLQRRFGRAGVSNTTSTGGTVSGWLAAATYQERLVGMTSSKIYEYGENAGRWVDRGRCTSWRGRANHIKAGNPSNIGAVDLDLALGGGPCDMAAVANYRCYVFDTYDMSGANVVTRTSFSLTDSTGTVYAADQQLATATAAAPFVSGAKVVAFGARFYIVYWDVSTAATLKTFLIDTTSATTIASSLAASAVTTASNLEPNASNYAVLDVAANSTYGPFLAYRSTQAAPNQIPFGFISTTGAFVTTSTMTTGGADPVSISVAVAGGNAMHGIVYSHDTNPSDIYAALRSFDGSVWTSTATSTAMETGMSASMAFRSHACIFDSATTLRVYYGDINTAVEAIKQRTYTTANVISAVLETLPRSFLASRPFLGSDGAQYYWVCNGQSNAQISRFLMTQDGVLAGVAQPYTATFSVAGMQYGMPHVVSSGTSFSMCTNRLVVLTGDGRSAVTAVDEVIVDMGHDQSHMCVEDGGILLIPGTFTQQHDGAGCTELNFLTVTNTASRIVIGAAQITNGAGALTSAAGTIYSYHVIQEWTNAQGHRERGTDLGAVTTAGADWLLNDDTVAFTIDCVPWTLKQGTRNNIEFVIYRTEANPTADSPFYKVGTIANDPTADTVTFTDLMSDADARLQPQFYQGTGEVDNVAPQGGYIVSSGNGRVFVAGGDLTPNKVQYSKAREDGEALAFNETLAFSVPTNTGPITGIACHGQTVVIFTRDAIYTTTGDGFTNTNSGSNYPPPQLVTADGGARGPRSVCRTPMGIMYQSAKGLMLFNQSLLQEYIGAPLEKLADPGDATGITVVPDLQQVRVSYAATTHVYDYFHRQWYVFTHGSAGPTCIWGDAHTAVGPANDQVEYDKVSEFTDNGDAYAVTITLGWQRMPATMQGNMRIRRVGVTGESLGAHYLTIYVRHDYATTINQTIETTVAGAGPLRKQWRIGRQICNAMEITIRDADLDVYGADVVQNTAGFRLNEITFEIGVRGGLGSRRIA